MDHKETERMCERVRANVQAQNQTERKKEIKCVIGLNRNEKNLNKQSGQADNNRNLGMFADTH